MEKMKATDGCPFYREIPFRCLYFNQDSRTLTIGGYDSRNDVLAGHVLVIDDDRRFQVHSRL